MRGKEYRGVRGSVANRITPAHAGKSTFSNILFLFSLDHPRTCGEKWVFGGILEKIRRITPAHAGKSL